MFLRAYKQSVLVGVLVAEWDTKYTYNFWRPFTAITSSNTGNPDLTSNPNWTPYLTTPNHPSYASGHTATGAGFEFLSDYFGNDPGVNFTVSSISLDGTPFGGTTYTFDNFTDPRQANEDSRIYGGIHFTFDGTAADELATQVGDYVFNTSLTTLPEPSVLLFAAGGLLLARRRRLHG